MLDLGGGTGSFLLAVLRQHPTIEATLFELPAAVAVARQRLAGNPLAARMRIVVEYQTLLATAGFRLTRIVPTHTPSSVIEAVPVI